MAPHHNNQDTISERRLRPIYDWLDNGNNKKALQEAEKVLRKQPTFQCCRALKSLALMRLGKEDEAMSILDKILEECPTDEGALQAMTIGYREMKLPDKICTLYENAVKKDPYNEEFLSHLFMAYVRLGQLKRQQATAMSLYKVKMKNPYYFWSVMSLVLQAIEGDEKIAQTVSLPLALKMVQKMDKEGKMEQEQETMLYLMILELKQDWKGAVDVLNSPLGKKLENSASFHLHCINKRIELEERLENWTEVARLSRNILLSQPDSWETATSYVRAVHCIQKSGRKGSLKEMQYDLKPNRIDRTLVEAESLMDCLGKGYPGLRGPKLAKLEICYRTMDGCSLSLQDLLMDYIDVFGTRPVCFSDIKKYLKVIPLEQRNDFILKLRERYPDEVPNSSGEIYREICLSGVERFLGKHSNLSTEMVESIVSGLINRYVACQPLVAHLERTELRPCDGYLVIASHLLWEKWEITRNIRFFLFSCSLLRLGLQYSPSNWQMKFLLIRLCGRAGAGSLCDEVHAGIDVKHIILDTLGWVILRVLFSTGQADRLDRLYCQMSRFYSHSPKETIEYIIQAYKCGNFSQICDIYNLKRRIQTSFLSHLVKIDRLMFDLLFKTLNHDQAVNHVGYPEYSKWDDIPWDRLRDNRDFRTIVSYEPEETATTEELVNYSFKLEVEYMRLRQQILRGIVSAINLTDDVQQHFSDDSPSSENMENELDISTLLSQMEEQHKACSQKLDVEVLMSTPQAPYRSRLSCYLPSLQVSVAKSFLSAVYSIHIYSVSQTEDESTVDILNVLLEQFTSYQELMGKEVLLTETYLGERWRVLELQQFNIESFCLAAVLSGSILSLLRSQKGVKKNKKKIVSPKFGSAVPKFNQLLDKLEEHGKTLHQTLQENYKKYISELESECLVDSFSSLSVNLPDLLGAEKQNLVLKMKESYLVQEQQMSTIIQDKIRYIQALKV